jgi:hypothetical protein
VDERFRVVVRWAALILLGVGAGGLASWVGVGPFAVLAGVVVAFVGGVFVGATIWATYLRSGRQDDLLGPSLFRAVSVGFLGLASLSALCPAWVSASRSPLPRDSSSF